MGAKLHSLKAAVAATACKDQNHVAPLRTHRQGRALGPPREPLEPQDQAQVPAEPRERDAPVRRAAALGAPAGVGERASHGRASRRARRLPGQSPGERAVADRARAQTRPREEARRSLSFFGGGFATRPSTPAPPPGAGPERAGAPAPRPLRTARR